jgi:hypothetical protein
MGRGHSAIGPHPNTLGRAQHETEIHIEHPEGSFVVTGAK